MQSPKHIRGPEKFPDWLEVKYTAEPSLAEAFGEFVTDLSGRGVIWQDLDDGRVLVIGYLEDGPEAPAQVSLLRRWADQPGREEGRLAQSKLGGRDWGENWKKHFKPFEAVPGLIIAPPWEQAPEPGDAKVLIIDPGMAFGTGQHESTLLILERLAALSRQGPLPGPVLDVGCGTGVLSLSALLWGAPLAQGLDNDPWALEAAEKNAALNGLQDSLRLSGAPLEDIEGRYPLVLVNIISRVIIDLADALAAHLAPGGELVLSGILLDQADEVEAMFARQGLKEVERLVMGEWTALVMA